ncbi:hypothetical protein B0H12DRAFT_219297 [Mycena haematopus]|nr:hypothetical protein B0H12DRAFT_219297 [Mycena haematopus]
MHDRLSADYDRSRGRVALDHIRYGRRRPHGPTTVTSCLRFPSQHRTRPAKYVPACITSPAQVRRSLTHLAGSRRPWQKRSRWCTAGGAHEHQASSSRMPGPRQCVLSHRTCARGRRAPSLGVCPSTSSSTSFQLVSRRKYNLHVPTDTSSHPIAHGVHLRSVMNSSCLPSSRRSRSIRGRVIGPNHISSFFL